MMVWVALGAGLGAGLRAALAVVLPLAGSLGANAIGSLLIGILAALPLSARMRAFAMTGFCGGFTTFSLFGFEVFILLQAGAVAGAAFYVAATLALSLGGAALGLRVGRRLLRRRAQ
jgi:fluoride exporter